MAWEAAYLRQYSDSDYNHLIDVFNDPLNLGFAAPFNGYPAFILNRKIQSDGVETKLTLHPLNWLRTTLSYQLTATEYSSTTDPNPPLFGTPAGGQIDDGRYRAQTYGITATLTPFRRLYFSGDVHLYPLVGSYRRQWRFRPSCLIAATFTPLPELLLTR